MTVKRNNPHVKTGRPVKKKGKRFSNDTEKSEGGHLSKSIWLTINLNSGKARRRREISKLRFTFHMGLFDLLDTAY